MTDVAKQLQLLQEEIVECRLCPRLVEYREQVAQVKRRAYRDQPYWGRPIPSFGDPLGRILIVGLAPAAHGANRTGRMFTGDKSGEFLFEALFEAGFASQSTSISRGDGLALNDVYISAAVHCAPPDNKPLPIEIRTCGRYLERELELLPNLRVVVVLGRIAFDVYLSILQKQGHIQRRSAFAFGHNAEHPLGGDLPVLISSYHPSQQNTSTGKLTASMFRDVFSRAKRLL